MFRIIVACLIMNIDSNLALKKKDSYGNNISLQNMDTYGKDGALSYNLDGTTHSPNTKEEKVIIKLLAEKPSLSKINQSKKQLQTEKLSLGILEKQMSATKKPFKLWSAFRRWQENEEGKPPAAKMYNKATTKFATRKLVTNKLMLPNLPTENSAIHTHEEIAIKTLMKNPSPREAVKKHQMTDKIDTRQLSLEKIKSSTMEWSALRRIKENVKEKFINSSTDKTAVESLQRGIVEKIHSFNTHKPLVRTPTKTKSEGEYIATGIAMLNTETRDHGTTRPRNNSKTKLLTKLKKRKIATKKATFEKSIKPKHRFTHSDRIKKSITKNIRARQFAKKKAVKVKLAPSKRAAVTAKPAQMCWDGNGVKQLPTRRPVGDRKINVKRMENGRIIYRNVNNRKSAVWVLKVKEKRKASKKKVTSKKTHQKKSKNGRNIANNIGLKRAIKKVKKNKGKVVTRERKA